MLLAKQCRRIGAAALFVCFFLSFAIFASRAQFVSVKGDKLYLGKRQYYFVGTNYWYGSLLPLEKDPARHKDIPRLRSDPQHLECDR